MHTKQVDKSHYKFGKYVHKRRWASMWHQLDEVIKLEPKRVLEVGPGPGLFKVVAGAMGINVETLDLDPELEPDHVASVFEMPFDDGAFDVVCAFQMLEHLPYEQSLGAFREMARVSNTAVVISLPDAATRLPVSFYVPKIGTLSFSIPIPRPRPPVHRLDAQHYWEINRVGYHYKHVARTFSERTRFSLDRTFRVPEYPYHRFFVFVTS